MAAARTQMADASTPADRRDTSKKTPSWLPLCSTTHRNCLTCGVGERNTRVAVERRDWPCFAANHRNVATCRILSQSAVIGRVCGSSAQEEKIAVPTPPRHFLINRGIFSWIARGGPVTTVTEEFLSRRCFAIPLQSMGSFPGSTFRALPPKWPGRQNFCPESPRPFPYL